MKSATVGVAAVIVGASVIAFAPILVKLSEVGPSATAFWRLAFALPALAVWAALERRDGAPRTGKGTFGLIVLAGVFFAGDLLTWHQGILRTTAANATFLANLTPILVGVLGWALFREPVTRGLVAAGALAIAGAGLLSGAAPVLTAERLLGDGLSVLTAVWYAAYLLAVRAARGRGAGTGYLMLVSGVAGAALCLAGALALGEALWPRTAAGWAYLAAFGLLVHAGGQGLLAFALGRVSTALTAVLILIQPVVAAGLGWLLFAEALSPVQMLGAGLALSGVWLAQRRPADAARAAAAPDR